MAYILGNTDPSGAAATWRAAYSGKKSELYTPASTAAEYRFQGNQPKIQNSYNYKKQVITGIHGLPFDQQNDDRYWQTKQILPNILRPLGSGIKNAAIINEGVYNINPIAGTNNFGGSDISLASGTNPTNYSIVNTTDIEDRLRAHAVPANDPLSAEFAARLAPDAQLKPNSVEGDPMLNTFRSEESIMRNAASQIYDENLMTGEEGDEPTESLVYGRLRANLLQAHRTMKNMDPHAMMRGMLMRNASEAIRRGAAKESGEVYDADNKREDLAAQAGNVGDTPGGFGGGGSGGGGSGGGAGGSGGGGRTAFAAGTHLNQPSLQVRNGRVGVNSTSKIGGNVMSQVDTIDNQNSGNTTNNLRYNFKTPSDVIDATIATALVRPIAHQSGGGGLARQKSKKQARVIPESEMPKVPTFPSKGRKKAVNRKDFPTGAGYGTESGSMQIDPATMRAFDEPATILSPQRVSDTTRESLEAERTPTGREYNIDGAIRELTQSDSAVNRAFGFELMGSSNSYAYEAFNRAAGMTDGLIEYEADQSLQNVQRVAPTISAVGDAMAKFIPTIQPPSNKKPVVDPSDVKMKQDNLRLQKERDDAINQLAANKKETSEITAKVLKQKERIANLEKALENAKQSHSEEARNEVVELRDQLHDAQKIHQSYHDALNNLASEFESNQDLVRQLRERESYVNIRAAGLEEELALTKAETNALYESRSGLMSERGQLRSALQELQLSHQTQIDELTSQLDSLGAQLEDAHSQKEVDIARINELHGELKRVNQELEYRQNYIPPSQIEPILADYQKVANEVRSLRSQPAREITVYRDTYIPSRYEGSGEMPSGKRSRDEVDSNIKNSMDSTHMIAGVIPSSPLPTPISNMSATNQLSESNNLPNMLDQRERIVSETKALRNYTRSIVGGGAVTERYEKAISDERREKEQKAELTQLVARVGRLVEAGKTLGSKRYEYSQEDIIKAYIQDINDSVTSATLSGCTTTEIVGAVNSALQVSAIKFHKLSISDKMIQANVSYSKNGIVGSTRFATIRGSKEIQLKRL